MIHSHEGPVEVSASEARYDGRSLKTLEAHFRGLIEGGKLQGASWILSRGGKVFENRALGNLTWKPDSPPLRTDSRRFIASISKMFTAVAVMQLVERGDLWIYQPISSVIKEFDTDSHRDITLVDLLTHTSGLEPDGGAMVEPYPRRDIDFKDTEEGFSLWLKDFLSGPRLRPRGTEWMYCSRGFAVLAEVVKRVSGQHFTDYVQERIFTPLGMENTGFSLSRKDLKNTCLVNEGQAKWMQRKPATYFEVFSGAGGIVSGLADMQRFGQALCNRGKLGGQRILGESTVNAMTRNHLQGVTSTCWGPKVKDYHYGLGFVLYEGGIFTPGCFGHEGAGRCVLIVDPAEEFVAFWYVPTSVSWVAESIRNPQPIIWSGLL